MNNESRKERTDAFVSVFTYRLKTLSDLRRKKDHTMFASGELFFDPSNIEDPLGVAEQVSDVLEMPLSDVKMLLVEANLFCDDSLGDEITEDDIEADVIAALQDADEDSIAFLHNSWSATQVVPNGDNCFVQYAPLEEDQLEPTILGEIDGDAVIATIMEEYKSSDNQSKACMHNIICASVVTVSGGGRWIRYTNN